MCASTHRLVDLEDVVRWVEVTVELVNEYVETADLLLHGDGHLCETTALLTFNFTVFGLCLVSLVTVQSFSSAGMGGIKNKNLIGLGAQKQSTD